MAFALEQDWQEIFRLAAEAKALKREKETKRVFDDLDRVKEQKHKRDEKEQKEAKELEDAVATSAELASFNAHLDDYDTQTVHALMENGEALDRLRTDLRRMEENAYVLPDGRRVFKTEDGQRVFDEHGAEVGRETIDPQMIDDRHTKWEPLLAAKAKESGLQTERQGLLDFQAKLDEARNRSSHGDLTKKELEALDADLKASAPPAVRQKLGLAPTDADRDAKLRAEDVMSKLGSMQSDDPSRRLQFAPAMN